MEITRNYVPLVQIKAQPAYIIIMSCIRIKDKYAIVAHRRMVTKDYIP